MIKIYTPGGYSGMFRSASIYIDGEYIYSADTYKRTLTGESNSAYAIGKISGDEIHCFEGAGMFFPKRTAQIVRKGSEIHIYKLPRGACDMPYLYIINDEIYTDEGLGIIYRKPCGYIGHGDLDGGSGKASDFGEIYDVLLGGGSADKPGSGEAPKGSGGDGPTGPGGDNPTGDGDNPTGGGDGPTGGGCLLVILAVILIYSFIKSAVSAAYDMATGFPLFLVMIAMVIVLSVKLKKTFGKVHASAAVKKQCNRAALPVTLKAMIIPVIAAVLGVAMTGYSEMMVVSVPFLVLLFVYCWFVVSRMMQAGLIDRKGHAPGGKTYGTGTGKFFEKLKFRGAGRKFGGRKSGGQQGPVSHGGTTASGRAIRPCPNCKAKCAVPAGRGEITITCPVCKTKYKART